MAAYQLSLQLIDKITKTPSRPTFKKWITAALKGRVSQTALTLRVVDKTESAVLNETYRQVPERISLSNLSFNQDYSLNIDGISSNQNDLDTFQKKLQNLTWYKNVTIQETNTKKINEQEFLEFKIKGQVVFSGESLN